jgi:hypothetical protein
VDSNFPYAGAMNLVFAPFVSRSIVRVLPEAHPARREITYKPIDLDHDLVHRHIWGAQGDMLTN